MRTWMVSATARAYKAGDIHNLQAGLWRVLTGTWEIKDEGKGAGGDRSHLADEISTIGRTGRQ